MFTTRRSRPRRASRFVPAVDGLDPRIAPVGIVTPIDPPPSAPPPAQTQPVDQELLDAIASFDTLCGTTAMDI